MDTFSICFRPRFRQSIVEHLCIPDGLNGVISDIPVPDNLTLTVSSDENRDYALIQLLQEPKFVDFRSIIVYCSRRDQCERVAKNLRTYFQVIGLFCTTIQSWHEREHRIILYSC